MVEWMASERILTDPLMIPATNFMMIRQVLEMMDNRAVLIFLSIFQEFFTGQRWQYFSEVINRKSKFQRRNKEEIQTRRKTVMPMTTVAEVCTFRVTPGEISENLETTQK